MSDSFFGHAGVSEQCSRSQVEAACSKGESAEGGEGERRGRVETLIATINVGFMVYARFY